MKRFIILFFCIQVCLLQNVLSQCSSNYGLGYNIERASIIPATLPSGGYCGGFSGSGLGYGLGGIGLIDNIGELGYGAQIAGGYGGVGEGNVAVIGELPVAGNTAVVGQVPILGTVSFCDNLPAAGSVSINGRCACECGQ